MVSFWNRITARSNFGCRYRMKLYWLLQCGELPNASMDIKHFPMIMSHPKMIASFPSVRIHSSLVPSAWQLFLKIQDISDNFSEKCIVSEPKSSEAWMNSVNEPVYDFVCFLGNTLSGDILLFRLGSTEKLASPPPPFLRIFFLTNFDWICDLSLITCYEICFIKSNFFNSLANTW